MKQMGSTHAVPATGHDDQSAYLLVEYKTGSFSAYQHLPSAYLLALDSDNHATS
jgi:hypothetical protein